MEKLKLSEKQLQKLTEIQQQKQQLTNLFSDLNQKESTIVELILDGKVTDINSIANIKLEDGSLVYEIVDKKPTKKVKSKKQDENIS